MTKVLVVDPDRDFRETLDSILSENGCEVHKASNVEEAIATLAAKQFDVMLVDTFYLGTDWIKNGNPPGKLVLITGCKKLAGEVKGFFDVTLFKPFGIDELFEGVRV